MRARITFGIVLLFAFVAIVLAATIEDRSAATIRYRNGSVLKFDAQSSIADEDAAWTLTAAKLSALANLSTTPAVVKNLATTNTVAALPAAIRGALGGFTGDMLVLTNGANTATLHITNGLVMAITAP